MKPLTYQETIHYLYNSLPMFQKQGGIAFKKDLSNTLVFCEYLKEPHQSYPSVHIAGTNGKGSSAHSIAAVLQTAGYKTGLYTSPHLKDFTERIKVNGKPMRQEAVCTFVSKHKVFINSLKPSFFETTVAMAFDYFRREQVDIAVIEVGMGGRLDSTNVINPLLSLITHIGYDHMEFLGDTLAKIAGEKAGIIKKKVPVVVSERQEETKTVFTNKAKEQESDIYFAQDDYQVEIAHAEAGRLVANITQGETLRYAGLQLSLTGLYQLKNLPGILKSLDLLNLQGFTINDRHILKGLTSVAELTGLKGRWQIVDKHPLIICDTGHNRGAFRETMKQLDQVSYRQLWMVLGFTAEKDLSSVLPLLPKDAYYLFCQADIPRAMDIQTLTQSAREFALRGKAFQTVGQAYQHARSVAQAQDCIFVGGSTFVVAELDDLL